VVIVGTTAPAPLSEGQAAELAEWTTPELVEALRNHPQPTAPLARELSLGATYILLGRSSLGSLAAEPGWDAFNRQYPANNGYLELSRVAFDPAGEQALVYASQTNGPGIGRGAVYLLEKTGGRWRLAGSQTLWAR
jgi:hypothetical protein